MKWSVFGNSVQGASHIRSGIECQDSHKKQICADGTVIMAVADGHGSKNCPFSKTGSSIAVNVFCKIMSDYISNYSDSFEQLITYLNREGDTKIAQEIDSQWKKRVEKIHRKNKRDIPINDEGETNKTLIYSQYGTTLLGLVLTKVFLFAFQIGDGDIVYVSQNGVEPVINADKILGVETHSLCKNNAWNKSITAVRRIGSDNISSSMFMLSSDGFSNSYKNEQEFFRTCTDYYEMINTHGAKAVEENLKSWLSETSEMGCGDDITVLIAYID
ncbi:PP2C family serine/threonine-protein phosphatase [uncultured Ruminococcus sp.]|uniref:PP2C family serine/threonine-protein phosphatase n=1 Tax=uncultured Ruminococcus sp. TaxID=165186 RepID=UPI0025E01251|nr:PP2C family serine/threonine-protein phosphatase [uncultured Ruminococcus sp.]